MQEWHSLLNQYNDEVILLTRPGTVGFKLLYSALTDFDLAH